MKTNKFLVRDGCARELSAVVFRNMSDDEYVAIQKLTHPFTGAAVYMPEGQALPDTKAMLERDGLISCKYNEHGKFVSALVQIRTTSALFAGN